MDAEETKRWKAKQLRYKKPIVRDLNLDKIQEDLWNIMEECENIRWYTDSDDGNDSLINALDGDEDEAYEFKMAFADLCAECERMQEDLQEEWIPNCFDMFFVAAGAGENFGGLLGWDSRSCMKVYKAVHERENKCKELHKEMNMNVGPTRLVQPDFYLLVDVDDLQKQVNTLENEVHRMKRAEARRKWRYGRKKY